MSIDGQTVNVHINVINILYTALMKYLIEEGEFKQIDEKTFMHIFNQFKITHKILNKDEEVFLIEIN